MKPAATFVVLALLVCAIILSVSATATEAAAQDIKPTNGDTEYGTELAKGRCIHGCCSRRKIIRTCVVCCASAEEAKAFAQQSVKGGMGRRGGASATATAAEAKAEANP